VLRLVLEDPDGSIHRMTLMSTRPLLSDFSDGQALHHIRALTALTGTKIKEVQQLSTVAMEMRSRPPAAAPSKERDQLYGVV
jgi:hypothetical protein